MPFLFVCFFCSIAYRFYIRHGTPLLIGRKNHHSHIHVYLASTYGCIHDKHIVNTSLKSHSLHKASN